MGEISSDLPPHPHVSMLQCDIEPRRGSKGEGPKIPGTYGGNQFGLATPPPMFRCYTVLIDLANFSREWWWIWHCAVYWEIDYLYGWIGTMFIHQYRRYVCKILHSGMKPIVSPTKENIWTASTTTRKIHKWEIILLILELFIRPPYRGVRLRRHLLFVGADPNIINIAGKTILHVSTGRNDSISRCEQISLLLQYGADCTIKDQNGNSVLTSMRSSP